jgi:hypothetical protein
MFERYLRDVAARHEVNGVRAALVNAHHEVWVEAVAQEPPFAMYVDVAIFAHL